uniref:Uncharacterized protein n=1 Tax=Rhizophora mucronata TaxID=61149 RepID=A0A2P2QAX7_RHIMU
MKKWCAFKSEPGPTYYITGQAARLRLQSCFSILAFLLLMPLDPLQAVIAR